MAVDHGYGNVHILCNIILRASENNAKSKLEQMENCRSIKTWEWLILTKSRSNQVVHILEVNDLGL